MTSNGIRIADGVSIEEMGDELLVMVPGNPEMYRLTGDARDVVIGVQSGSPLSAVEPVIAEELVRLGVLSSTLPSRRSVLRGISIGAGAGICALSIPSVAAASSPGSGGGSGTVVSGAVWGPSGQALRFTAPVNIGSGAVSNLTITNPPAGVNATIGLTNPNGIFWEQAFVAVTPVAVTGTYTRGGVQYQATFQWQQS